MKRKLPEHGWCFVCGSENPHSIGLTLWMDDDGVLTSEFTLNEAQQGPPNYAHGGASAAILDEAMGLVVWAAGLEVAAVNLEINYQKPLPLHQPLRVEARITQTRSAQDFQFRRNQVRGWNDRCQRTRHLCSGTAAIQKC